MLLRVLGLLVANLTPLPVESGAAVVRAVRGTGFVHRSKSHAKLFDFDLAADGRSSVDNDDDYCEFVRMIEKTKLHFNILSVCL